MRNENFRIVSCLVLAGGILLGLSGCSKMSSKPVRKEEIIAANVDNSTAEYDIGGQSQDIESSVETEIENAAKFGNPQEVLNNSAMTSNVEVKKTGEDELQIEFELENVGLCTFAAGKGEKFVLPNEVFVDFTKIEWTAPTANGECLFPYMKVNETGDMFMIDWAYNGYCFAIYGKSPQNTSDRDMAGKIALAIISNLEKAE